MGNEVRLGHFGFISKSRTTPCQQSKGLHIWSLVRLILVRTIEAHHLGGLRGRSRWV